MDGGVMDESSIGLYEQDSVLDLLEDWAEVMGEGYVFDKYSPPPTAEKEMKGGIDELHNK